MTHWEVAEDSEITVYEEVGGKPVTVAYVDNPDGLQPGDDGYSKLLDRAYLIAAAPDLRAACEAMQAIIGGFTGHLTSIESRRWITANELARAAVTKAKQGAIPPAPERMWRDT